jgi:predicted TIM-barrel fold metal-dependent hydrolase
MYGAVPLHDIKKQLLELKAAGDPGRFLFGTDWPICSMKSYVSFVRQLNLPDESYRMMMAENSRRLFRLTTETRE